MWVPFLGTHAHLQNDVLSDGTKSYVGIGETRVGLKKRPFSLTKKKVHIIKKASKPNTLTVLAHDY